MNYFNSLTELDVTTTHLSEQGANQVHAFADFVKPLIPDIKKGDAAKAKIAEYYLEHKDDYTDGCKKILEPMVVQLGVSSSYISQIKKAKEYKETLQNPSLKQWVEEHPVSVQYHIAKAPHDSVMSKFLSGNHCSKREAEEFTRVKNAEKISSVSEPVKTEFQQALERQQDMVDDDQYPLIRTTGAAAVFMAGNRKDILAAAAQVLHNYKYRDENLAKIIDIVSTLADKAQTKPHYTPKSLSEV